MAVRFDSWVLGASHFPRSPRRVHALWHMALSALHGGFRLYLCHIRSYFFGLCDLLSARRFLVRGGTSACVAERPIYFPPCWAGSVPVRGVDVDGALLRELGRGACFGERALLFHEPRSAKVGHGRVCLFTFAQNENRLVLKTKKTLTQET